MNSITVMDLKMGGGSTAIYANNCDQTNKLLITIISITVIKQGNGPTTVNFNNCDHTKNVPIAVHSITVIKQRKGPIAINLMTMKTQQESAPMTIDITTDNQG